MADWLRKTVDAHRGSAVLRAIFLGLLFSVAASTPVVSAATPMISPQELEIAGLQIEAWIPERGTPGPLAGVYFFHGFDGCDTQSTFLMEALAKSGYAIFAPNHQDAGCGMMIWPTRPDAPFRDPSDWTENIYKDRRVRIAGTTSENSWTH
jgi:hypothetical protein